MLQLFHLDVAEVDLDVASVCFPSVSAVLYVCCECFIWMFHILAMAFQVF